MISKSEILRFILEDEVSAKKQHAKKGVKYYEAEHDIEDYRVYFYNEDGILEEDLTKNNARISHPFFTELTDQCTQYMMSGKDVYVKSDDAELQKYLNDYFDDDFKTELSDLITYTSVEGHSYLYRYMGEDLRSKFKFADALNVVEVSSKYTSDKQDYVIYKYFWKTEKNKNIFKVEVWDKDKVTYYLLKDSTLTEDKENKPRPHVLYSEDETKYYDTFGTIPFIRLDNNRKQLSDLHVVKDLIDDYDLMACGLSNNIQDMAEGFFVVKGFGGNDISEITEAIKKRKQIGVDESGDVDIKTVNIPYEARRVKLELDEKNIYRFGMGLDSSRVDGTNVTNMAIKSRYALLDIKANKKETQLRKMMLKVIQIVLDEINKDNETAYELSDVYMDFERVVPTNEIDNEQIKLVEANRKQVEVNTLLNVMNSQLIDNETILKNLCDVLEIDIDTIKQAPIVPSVADATQTLLESN